MLLAGLCLAHFIHFPWVKTYFHIASVINKHIDGSWKKKKIYILKLLLNLCTFWVLPDLDPYISSFSESHGLIPLPNCLPKCPLPKCSFPLQLPYCRPASCLTWRTSLDYPWQLWSQIQPLSALPPRMTSRLNRRCPISCSSGILYVLLTLHKVLSISWLIL